MTQTPVSQVTRHISDPVHLIQMENRRRAFNNYVNNRLPHHIGAVARAGSSIYDTYKRVKPHYDFAKKSVNSLKRIAKEQMPRASKKAAISKYGPKKRGYKGRRQARRRTRKKQSKSVTVRQSGNLASASYVNVKYKKSKIYGIIKPLTGTLQYSGNYSGQWGTSQAQTTARQYSNILGTILTGTNYDSVIKAYYNNLPTTNPFYQKWPDVTKGDTGVRPFFMNVTQKYEMLNQTEATTHVDIYTVMANTSTDYEDPLTTWTSAIVYDKGSGGGGTTPTLNFPQMRPQMFKQFNLRWKTIQHTSVELLPGIVHTHTFKYKPNRFIEYSHILDYPMIKGITYATFAVARGTPVDNVKGVQGVQTVSYAPVKIDYVVTENYTWKMLNIMPRNHYYTNAMGNLVYDETSALLHLYQQNQSGGAGPVDLNDENLMG